MDDPFRFTYMTKDLGKDTSNILIVLEAIFLLYFSRNVIAAGKQRFDL